MCDLALYSNHGLVSATDISKRENISLDYLKQLLNRLKRGGLLLAIRGPKGGYRLSRQPDKITILEIINTLGSSITPVFCLSRDNAKKCNRVEKCVTRILWKKLGDKITQILGSTSLKDLCAESKTFVKKKKVDKI